MVAEWASQSVIALDVETMQELDKLREEKQKKDIDFSKSKL